MKRPVHALSSEMPAEMNTGSRSRLPSDFLLSPSHCPHFTPSHSPPLSSRPFSPTLRSSVNSPLASYATARHRHRILLQPEEPAHHQGTRVSLSALSPADPQLGAVGGHFKSTTRIKCVPLPALYVPQQVGTRGIRTVRLHTDRYLPSRRSNHTISDSLLCLPSLENRPRTRLDRQEVKLQRTRLFKNASGVLPHRMEQSFYMSGHSVHIGGRQDYPHLEEMKAVQFAENPTLYYGRGIAPGPRGLMQSRAVQRLRFNTGLEQNRNYDMGGDFEVGPTDGCGLTPTPITMENLSEMNTHSKKRTFVTEFRT